MLSGMGADELFAGYRKHLANQLALRYQRIPRTLRRGVFAAVDRLPVATARRGYRSVRFAKRFLSFAELPEETAFRRSYTMYDQAELLALVTRSWPGRSRTCSPSTRTSTTTTTSTTSSTACAWATPGCSCRA